MSNSRAGSQNRDDEENAQLLNEQSYIEPNVKQKKKKFFAVAIGAFLITVSLAAIIFEISSLLYARKNKRNVILLISDGFGPASETFGRSYYQFVNDLPWDQIAPLDKMLVGTSRTRSSSSLVTDSAAGATAFSCAIKTYNAGIGVHPDQTPCGTILESAKAKGILTGLVVTSRITHATPASFSAHVINRNMESEIAAQQIGDYPLGRQVDLMFGGGRCYFLGNSTEGSCRTDTRDVMSDAKKQFHYLNAIRSLPILGLFTLDHMSYEIDRDPATEPSLKEMSAKAIELLTKATEDSDKGFFLMIEGSRIDMAAHSNDAPTHAHEISAYYETIDHVREYVDNHPNTVMISVSDHETGGLALSRQNDIAKYPQYQWFPEILQRVNMSSYLLAKKINEYNEKDKVEFIKNSIREELGIDDFTEDDVKYLSKPEEFEMAYEYYLSNMTSARALIGWSTHGHTAVDVNLYAHGMNAEKLAGNHENTHIGDFIIDFLGLDLSSITLLLNKDNSSFHLSNYKDISQFNIDNLAHYHHGHQL
ncbi:7262_t:CDS:10 [Ambispora gerdemannii]|uniref:Alkaline phosphatase n=1 Tax=Ambispora gerdemannii TaxID=144530 RepID=A0A9N9C5B5_9GLOM|nr:7262_t:CDS:10 [Ambispora gerdemannii]